jgi:hypothetical protein
MTKEHDLDATVHDVFLYVLARIAFRREHDGNVTGVAALGHDLDGAVDVLGPRPRPAGMPDRRVAFARRPWVQGRSAGRPRFRGTGRRRGGSIGCRVCPVGAILVKAASLQFLQSVSRFGDLSLELFDAFVTLGHFPPQPLDFVKQPK